MNFLKKIYNEYICVRLSDYKGFESDLQINKLLFFVFLGLCAACVIITYYNGTTALVLKKLVRIGAFGEEKGKTLSELGLGSSRAVKRVLSNKSGSVKHLILQAGAKKLSYEEYTELENSKKELKGLSVVQISSSTCGTSFNSRRFCWNSVTCITCNSDSLINILLISFLVASCIKT